MVEERREQKRLEGQTLGGRVATPAARSALRSAPGDKAVQDATASFTALTIIVAVALGNLLDDDLDEDRCDVHAPRKWHYAFSPPLCFVKPAQSGALPLQDELECVSTECTSSSPPSSEPVVLQIR